MKILLAALLLSSGALASGQEVYFQTWFTNWQPSNVGPTGPGFGCTNRFSVGSNQVVFQMTGASLQYWKMYAIYDQATVQVYGSDGESRLSGPVMGPCTVQYEAYFGAADTPRLILWRLVDVNSTPVPGMAVVPAGVAATLRLDTSTNLSTWQTVTNASLSPAAGNRFFRLSLSIP